MFPAEKPAASDVLADDSAHEHKEPPASIDAASDVTYHHLLTATVDGIPMRQISANHSEMIHSQALTDIAVAMTATHQPRAKSTKQCSRPLKHGGRSPSLGGGEETHGMKSPVESVPGNAGFSPRSCLFEIKLREGDLKLLH
ncbi:uncharacterized protein N7515_004089 [Penicillium bovifimosum]|uniref:Uncharacterized protein n=1 Tax=Penicillium bovifimosum TaxID=126998 RepID=A0A9W9H6B9_9EURO|nr:uncharacterized protein N7515_004089 [Penicillium bovifimosum]KAJ5139241.1 hypothetical protein N7515_004089 [Penicillium bovifimosum]